MTIKTEHLWPSAVLGQSMACDGIKQYEMTFYTLLIAPLFQQLQIEAVITIIEENILPSISTLGNVMRESRYDDSG